MHRSCVASLWPTALVSVVLPVPLIFAQSMIALGNELPYSFRPPSLAMKASIGANQPAQLVEESARGIPIAYTADVVVVGGSTGAVAAAVAARQAGAQVFLAAPRPYLGDDMTATLRLWLEPDEVPDSPLAEALFAEQAMAAAIADPTLRLPLTYQADRPSAAPHKDTAPPTRLTDGQWGSAVHHSVQYDGDVTILADLGSLQSLQAVQVLAFHKDDFRLDRVTVTTSTDRETWHQTTVLANRPPEQATTTEPALNLSAALVDTARYVKFTVTKRRPAKRILLGEIAVIKARAPRQPTRTGGVPPARPLHIKKTLDEALLTAGVPFLYSCYATDVLRDVAGNPCGIVMANRAGRQAIVAKVIVDATDRAWLTRMAGAPFRPFPSGLQTVRRVVIGGAARSGADLEARLITPPYQIAGKVYPIVEYTLKIPLADGGYAAWAEAEQIARDRTYHPDQQFTSDGLDQVPPDPMHGQAQGAGAWAGVAALDLRVCRPAGVPRIWVLGGCVDVPRDSAARLLRPPALIQLGTRIGTAAAAEAGDLPAPEGVRLAGTQRPATAAGDVMEVLAGVRPVQKLAEVSQQSRALPVLDSYDVVVIGGGTSGAPAGIAAARQDARVLVVEYLHGLGGVGTQGAISKYYWGNRVGFTAEVGGGSIAWSIEQKAEWWRTTLRQAGANIWFGAMGCGALVEQGRIAGAVVATPEGRGVVLAKVVIDATGNADIAAAAGAPCLYTDGVDVAVQGTGLPPRRLGASYTNTDFTIVDETDMMDVWHVHVYAKHKAGDAFDMGKLVDTRERRRIVGDQTISILDEVNQRTYPDTIATAYSDFDTHGYTLHPYFTLQHPPHRQGFRTDIPYRAMLPRGLDGILVTGLGISAQRDAIPVIRMQPDIQNQGYAAGVAAALAARRGGATRQVDIRALQYHLIACHNLPESVLTDKDSYPMPRDRIAAAVAAVQDGYRDIAVVLAHSETSLPLLRVAHADATGPDRLTYAHVLAVLGDPTGIDQVIAAVEALDGLDEGWHYTGMGQYGYNMSRLDRWIYALGRTGDRRALGPILAKLKLLKPESAFSHFRAMALALESIGDPAAAAPLAAVLALPGIRGHACPTVEAAVQRAKDSPSWTATEPRSHAIRELMLARALYRCGDQDDLGRTILAEYAGDLRGHLARHADAVLKGPAERR